MVKTIKVLNSPVSALTFLNEGEFVAGGHDGELGLWNIEGGGRIVGYHGHSGKVIRAKRYTQSPSKNFISSAEDGKVILWDKDAGNILQSINVNNVLNRNNSFSNYVINFAIGSNKYQVILQLDGYHSAYIWDFNSNGFFMLGGTEQIPIGGSAAAYANRESLAIASSGTALYLYDLDNGRVIRHFCGSPLGYTDKQHLFIFSKENEFANNFSAVFQSGISGMHYDVINSIEFSADDKYFISGSSDCSVMLWKLEDILNINRSNKPPVFLEKGLPVHFVSFLHDEEQIAAVSKNGTILIWDIKSMSVVQRYSLSNKPILSFSVSPSRKLIAAGSSDGTVTVWKL